MPSRLSVTLALFALAALATLVAGCGGSSSDTSSAFTGRTNVSANDAPPSVFPAAAGGGLKALVTYRHAPGNAEQSVLRGHGGRVKQQFHLVNTVAVDLSAAAIEALRDDPRVQAVEPDAVVTASAETMPWGVKRIGAPTVHSSGNRGAGVKVAVIDTGIEYTHPDLDGNYAGGYDFVNQDSDPADDNGHGTHCAGTLAAELGNATGVVGVAPQASIYALKALDASGNGSYSHIISALQWCVDNGMQVASMSLGGSTTSTALATACQNAYSAGIILVAAAGNNGSGTDTVTYPAKYDSVVAVSATSSMDLRASYSSTGPSVEIAAPGSSIISTVRGGGTGSMSGTSMACPHVAGVAALVIAAGLVGNPAAVRSQLTSTATDMGVAGRDPQYGFGLVDADQAVVIAAPPPPVEPPIDPIPFPAAPTHDLSCTALTTPIKFIVGRTASISIGIGNIGTVAEVAAINLYNDATGQCIATVSGHSIEAGATSTIGVSWRPTAPGTALLRAQIVPASGETSTSDNVRLKQVTVR